MNIIERATDYPGARLVTRPRTRIDATEEVKGTSYDLIEFGVANEPYGFLTPSSRQRGRSPPHLHKSKISSSSAIGQDDVVRFYVLPCSSTTVLCKAHSLRLAALPILQRQSLNGLTDYVMLFQTASVMRYADGWEVERIAQQQQQ